MHQPRRVCWNASCDLCHRSHPDLLNGSPEHRLEFSVEHEGTGRQRKRQFHLDLFVSAIARNANPHAVFHHPSECSHRESAEFICGCRRTSREIKSRRQPAFRKPCEFFSGCYAARGSTPLAASSAAIAAIADSNFASYLFAACGINIGATGTGINSRARNSVRN
jgi:hypothetical protein